MAPARDQDHPSKQARPRNPKQAFLTSGELKENNRNCCEDLLGAQNKDLHHVRQPANQVAWMYQVLSIRSSEEQPLAV